MCQRCPAPACQDEIPPMCGPLSPSASEEIPPCVVRSDRQACDALAPFRQDAAATARPALPSQRKSIHTNLSDTFEIVVIVCFRRCGISLLSHIHINMFDAFVKQLMILHCCGGMSLVLSIHMTLFRTIMSQTRLMRIPSRGKDSVESQKEATRKTANTSRSPSSLDSSVSV